MQAEQTISKINNLPFGGELKAEPFVSDCVCCISNRPALFTLRSVSEAGSGPVPPAHLSSNGFVGDASRRQGSEPVLSVVERVEDVVGLAVCRLSAISPRSLLAVVSNFPSSLWFTTPSNVEGPFFCWFSACFSSFHRFLAIPPDIFQLIAFFR
jgi:hypothetical protein